MKIVNILGGLGNQMFVYAMYLALKEAHPDEDVYICKRSYNGYPLHNGYELNRVFHANAPEASVWQLAKIAYPYWNYRTWQLMRHLFPRRSCMLSGTEDIPFDYENVTRKEDGFYDGYWQNENNFLPIRNKILEAFRFPEFIDDNNKSLAKLIASKNTVSCHVRRGDYLKDPLYGVCTSEYYVKAIDEINRKVLPELYCVFSDDIKWCKENLGEIIGKDKEIVFVDWNKGENSFRDMQLMSLCNHNIIANSSFSWWGAWLNNHADKVVVAPNIWMNKPMVNDPLCDSWIKIKVNK